MFCFVWFGLIGFFVNCLIYLFCFLFLFVFTKGLQYASCCCFFANTLYCQQGCNCKRIFICEKRKQFMEKMVQLMIKFLFDSFFCSFSLFFLFVLRFSYYYICCLDYLLCLIDLMLLSIVVFKLDHSLIVFASQTALSCFNRCLSLL